MDKKIKCINKSLKNIMRFSDLSKDFDEHSENKNMEH